MERSSDTTCKRERQVHRHCWLDYQSLLASLSFWISAAAETNRNGLAPPWPNSLAGADPQLLRRAYGVRVEFPTVVASCALQRVAATISLLWRLDLPGTAEPHRQRLLTSIRRTIKGTLWRASQPLISPSSENHFIWQALARQLPAKTDSGRRMSARQRSRLINLFFTAAALIIPFKRDTGYVGALAQARHGCSWLGQTPDTVLQSTASGASGAS